MKKVLGYIQQYKVRFAVALLGVAGVLTLMLYRIGSLTGGISINELVTLNTPVGIEAVYNNPFYLPLQVVRSLLFVSISDFGGVVGRLPNALFGMLAVICFAYVVWRWHGRRTAVFATALFGTSAWVLHVSRIASFDVMYLCTIPVLLATGVLLQKYVNKPIVLYVCILAWMAVAYIPGMIWMVAITVYWQRDALVDAWKHSKRLWQRALGGLLLLVSLPLLVINPTRSGQLIAWIGAPDQWAAPLLIVKQYVAVGVHLFVRGPQYPEIWLDKVPVLDIFTLAMCLIGIYFYLRHLKAFRAQMLLSYAVAGWLLVGAHGAVGLSLLVPLLYIAVAAGLAYLLREWLQVFPKNPLARGAGIALISLAVCMSCLYNVRAYFVAWPNNETTKSLFRYDR